MPPAIRFLSGFSRKLLTDLLPAAFTSGLVGLIFSHLVSPPAPNAGMTDIKRMMHDAQEIARDYSLKEEDLRRQTAMTTVLVLPAAPAESGATNRDTWPSRDAKSGVASATREVPAKKTERPLAGAAQQKPAAPNPLGEKPQPAEPLVLSDFTAIPPAPAKPTNFFAATLHSVVSVVRKVPDWAGSAADFVLDLPIREPFVKAASGGGFAASAGGFHEDRM
jgi:hypothetical protein